MSTGGDPSMVDAIAEAFSNLLEPLTRPVVQLRDQAMAWPEDFKAQLSLWLVGAVSYVGDRFWGAVGERAYALLREVTATNDFTHILSEVPADWTYRNPVVWSLWAIMTGCFLAFLAPQVASLLATAAHKRRAGSPWGDLFDDGFQLVLGVGAALMSPLWATLILLIVNVMAGAIVQESTVLPGMPAAPGPGEAARNAGLVWIYASVAFVVLLERIASVAVLMLCLVLSGWGMGSYFWPRMGQWWRVWRTLATAALGSMLLQNLLFRLGGETINRVLSSAPAETRASTFLGLTLGLACVVLCVLAPALLGGAYAAGAVARTGRRLAQPVTAPVMGAVSHVTSRAPRTAAAA